MFDISGVLKGDVRIGTKTVLDILRSFKLREPSITCPRNNPENIYIEEVTQYNDVFKSIREDKTTKTFVVKTMANKRLVLCFEPRMDRIQVRTVQQKLADITTDYVLSSISDKAFTKTFTSFYTPMAIVLAEYAKLRNLAPSDLAFFYKGGNMFRIVLGGLIKLFDNPEYAYLLKRSDADFQIYINPSLRNAEEVRKEVTTLVVYVMYGMREYVRKSRTLRVSGSTTALASRYSAEMAGIVNAKDVNVILREAARKDFVVAKGKVLESDPNDYVLLQEMDTLLDGLKASGRSTYFVSRNTSLDFARKDKLKATFDLLRFRRNFKLEINSKTGEKYTVNAPFEIIDVSIPKGEDYALKKMHTVGVGSLLREYTYTSSANGKNKVTFVAPTVAYLLNDLHDLLFKQNEYPWHDIKYKKRITRYFLTIIVFSIVEAIHKNGVIRTVVQNIIDSFVAFRAHLQHPPANATATYKDMHKMTTLDVLAKEMATLETRIAAITDGDLRRTEVKNMKAFVLDMASIFHRLASELDRIAKDPSLESLYDKVSFGITQTF